MIASNYSYLLCLKDIVILVVCTVSASSYPSVVLYCVRPAHYIVPTGTNTGDGGALPRAWNCPQLYVVDA